MKPVIYALLEPDALAVRYVGQTIHYEYRMDSHLSQHDNTRKSRWIKSLSEKGKKFTSVILEELKSVDELNQAEAKWIKYYRDNGVKLLNRGGREKSKLTPDKGTK